MQRSERGRSHRRGLLSIGDGALERQGLESRPELFPGQSWKILQEAWHHVEAYFKLNSIANGKGQSDGQVKYWYDNELIIAHTNAVMRTGAHPDMKWNQFLITPYIGDGSPVEQSMWVDDLQITTSRVSPKSRGFIAP